MFNNVVLIGFSGSGKSSVGRLLAQRLDWEFIDTDARIVERFHMPIAQLFREQGEAAFRRAETEAVFDACQGSQKVISVGGGAPVAAVNRERICRGNFVVRLEASPEALFERLWAQTDTEDRPMLAADDPLERIRGLLAQRADAYGVAHLSIDTEDRTPVEVAEAILAELNQHVSAGNR